MVKHDHIKFGCRMGDTILSCERGYVHDSIDEKHEIFSYASSDSVCGKCWGNFYGN